MDVSYCASLKTESLLKSMYRLSFETQSASLHTMYGRKGRFSFDSIIYIQKVHMKSRKVMLVLEFSLTSHAVPKHRILKTKKVTESSCILKAIRF